MSKYVKWTSSEELKVAKRAQEIRDNPEVAENRLPSGQRCKSLAMCYGLAQNILDEERRKHRGTFNQMGGEKLAASHKGIMAHAAREQELERAAAEGKARDAEREREARTPPPAPADPLAPLKLLLGEFLAQAIAEGILRAAAALEVPLKAEPADGARAHGMRVEPGFQGTMATVAAVVQSMAQRSHRTPVDVVGLKGSQVGIVQKSPAAAAFDIRFIPADSHYRNRDLRDDVVLCTKFISHHTQKKYRQANARLHFANGGPQSVIEQLEVMTHGNGAGNGEAKTAPH